MRSERPSPSPLSFLNCTNPRKLLFSLFSRSLFLSSSSSVGCSQNVGVIKRPWEKERERIGSREREVRVALGLLFLLLFLASRPLNPTAAAAAAAVWLSRCCALFPCSSLFLPTVLFSRLAGWLARPKKLHCWREKEKGGSEEGLFLSFLSSFPSCDGKGPSSYTHPFPPSSSFPF